MWFLCNIIYIIYYPKVFPERYSKTELITTRPTHLNELNNNCLTVRGPETRNEETKTTGSQHNTSTELSERSGA